MNRKLVFFAMLASLLATGLVLAGCDNGNGGGGKTITVSGFPLSGTAGIMLFDSAPTPDTTDPIAYGLGTISSGSGSFTLYDGPGGTGNPWNGSGNYYVEVATETQSYISKYEFNIDNTIVYSSGAFTHYSGDY
jgi:predicted small secreted protein